MISEEYAREISTYKNRKKKLFYCKTCGEWRTREQIYLDLDNKLRCLKCNKLIRVRKR